MKSELDDYWLALRRARDAGDELGPIWDRFVEAAKKTVDKPPVRVSDVLDQLRACQNGRDPAEVVILDHGCGSGFALLYLMALGYTNVFGVDPNKQFSRNTWSRLLIEVFGIDEPRFSQYDGKSLPLPDQSVDFIFSNQVVDHITNDCWNSYFAEEARVARAGACIFHEIPHRLVPYDSHTRTWLLHYLPRAVHRGIYRLIGYDPSVHWLRMPGNILRKIEHDIGPFEDITVATFLARSDIEFFDGPRALRRIVYRACTTRGLKPIATAFLRRFMMLRLVVTKPQRAQPPGEGLAVVRPAS